MPLDPSIILGGQPAATTSPLELASSVVQLQAVREAAEVRRLAAEEARQKAADAAAIRKVLTETGGDVVAALPRLRTIAPRAALEFETEIARRQKEGFDALKSKQELASKQLDLGIRLLQGVDNQQAYDLVRPMIGTMAPQIAEAMGETYDPARVQQFLQVGLTQKDLYDRRQDALKLFTEGKGAQGVGQYLSTAQSQEEWDGILKSAGALGVPAAVLAPFGTTYSPEAAARAGQLAITPEKRAELAGQAATRAETARHDRATEATAAGHLAVAQAAERRQAAQAGTAPSAKELAQSALSLVARLETHPGMGAATGAYELRGHVIPSQNAVDFNAIRDQLVAALALPNLGHLKGSMSDKDILFVQNLATRLGNRRLSEAETRTALQEARTFLESKGASLPRTPTPKVGDVVTVKGQRVRVTKVLPDGRYEGEVVR